ncbi:MAG: ABC transporter substrate-binding protein, partial [Nitratireductor sp.]
YQIILSSLEEHESPLIDKKVRQALNYAVDKQAIIDSLFFGNAVALNGQVLRKPQIGFNPDLSDYPYDPDKARALLAEAGYPDGFEITFKFPSGRYAQDREVSEAVAGMLSEVGVKADMVALEPGEFLRQLRAKELQPMAFVGLAPQDDPDLQVAQYHSTWRYSYIKNAELDALIDAGKQEMDREKRVQIYKDAMALMHEEAPIIFLYGGVDFYGTSAKLSNFMARGDGRFFLYDTDLSELPHWRRPEADASGRRPAHCPTRQPCHLIGYVDAAIRRPQTDPHPSGIARNPADFVHADAY